MAHESDEVLDIAREGRGMMPALSEKTISDSEILDVVQYLKSISSGSPSPSGLQPTYSQSVLLFGSRIESASIKGDMPDLAKASADASVLLSQSPNQTLTRAADCRRISLTEE
jgi:hypothetical protein